MPSISYEVFGKVQGVWFRKYTKKKADLLKIRGWVQNTAKGTVVGEACGNSDSLAIFEKFLREEGSPKSRIDACDIEKFDENGKDFPDFTIVR